MWRFITGLLGLSLLIPCQSQAQTAVRFSTDWIFDGTTAEVLQAEAKGYFKDEGLAVTIDRGYGAGDTISKVASGAYQFAMGDVTALIEYNARHPDDPLVGIMMLYDKTAFSVITTTDKKIQSIADLSGRKIAALTNETMSRLFPTVARLNGLDPAKAPLLNVSGQIRDTLLRTGEVDAVIGFFTTTSFNLETNGVPRENVRYFKYTDFGLDLYGSAIIVKTSYAESNPKVVAGFVKALMHGLTDTIKNPSATIPLVKAHNSIIDEAIELRRLQFTLSEIVVTPYVQAHGLGGVDEGRLAKHIDIVGDALSLPAKPSTASVFTSKFLPPVEMRQAQGSEPSPKGGE
jgi:NitT/TauT family transport system substrate-binding protein